VHAGANNHHDTVGFLDRVARRRCPGKTAREASQKAEGTVTHDQRIACSKASWGAGSFDFKPSAPWVATNRVPGGLDASLRTHARRPEIAMSQILRLRTHSR
jgi:hypothetical protein